jgi:hypothetical protein
MHTLRPADDIKQDANGADATLQYNVRIANTKPGTLMVANYVDNRPSALLDKPENYRLAVTRFTVPTTTIPLFYYQSSTSVPPAPPAAQSIVTMTYVPTGAQYRAELVLVPINPLLPAAPDIYTYNQYLTMLNNAFTAAFAALKLAHAGIAATYAPYMTFDATTSLFTYTGQSAMNDPGNNIAVYISYPIARLFGSIKGITGYEYLLSPNDPRSFQLNIINTNDNAVAAVPPPPVVGGLPGFSMVQEFSTLPLWLQIQSVSFQVFGISVTSEYLSSVPVGIPADGTPAGANLVSFVLTDFEPLAAAIDQTNLQYFASGPLRWFSILGSFPVRSINISVYYTDTLGVVRPVRLAYPDVLTMKIEFRRKELNLT